MMQLWRLLDDKRAGAAFLALSAVLLALSFARGSGTITIIFCVTAVVLCLSAYPGRRLRASNRARAMVSSGIYGAFLAVLAINVVQVWDDPVALAVVPVIVWCMCAGMRESWGMAFDGSARQFERAPRD